MEKSFECTLAMREYGNSRCCGTEKKASFESVFEK